MEDTGSEAMSEEGELRRSVEEGTTEEIFRTAPGEDGDVGTDKRANKEGAPAVEGEMNNNVMVKEDLPMEQSSDEDSDDLEVELMEEENERDQVKELIAKRPEKDEVMIKESEAEEGDKWEEGGVPTLTGAGKKSKVACELDESYTFSCQGVRVESIYAQN